MPKALFNHSSVLQLKTKLFVTSEVPIFQIFSDEPDTPVDPQDIPDAMRIAMDDLVSRLAVPQLAPVPAQPRLR